MRTRWDELAAPFDRLAVELGVGDRALLAAIVARSGWGTRAVTAPLLPSGVRHGVPWGLSIAMMRDAPSELRVFLEAQADPPGRDAYWAAAEALLDGIADTTRARALGRGDRMWHAVAFARDRAPEFHAYVCVPDRPELAWRALARAGHDGDKLRRELGPRARVTIVSTDVGARAHPRTKLYAITDEPPHVDAGAAAFMRAMMGSARDTRIGWLACYGFTPGAADPTSIALHFGAAVHGDAGLADRLAAYTRALELPDHARALGAARHHFVSYQLANGAPRVTVYLLPEVAR